MYMDCKRKNKVFIQRRNDCWLRRSQRIDRRERKAFPGRNNEFIKVTWHKVNIVILLCNIVIIAFLYTSNNWNLTFQKQFNLQWHPQKYILNINLTKYVPYLYMNNYVWEK